MTNVTLAELHKGGYIVDVLPHNMTPSAFSRADNIRFTLEGAETFEGYIPVYDQNPVVENPKWLLAWQSSTGFRWLYAGDTKLATLTGIAHTDVTRLSGPYTATNARWSGTLLGELPIITTDNLIDPPQGWDGTRFEDLPNWPALTYAHFLNVYERFVIAYKVQKNSVFNPRLVKWSEPADPSTYPNSWDETDPTKLTGEVTLSDTAGEIVTAELLGTYNIIYKSDSVVLMRFVGGSQIFSFDTLFSDFGALSQRSVVTWENKHFVVTDSDVIIHNGHSYESIITGQVKDALFNNINADYTQDLVVRLYERQHEIWICYPDVNSPLGKLNKVLAWNYKTKVWGSHDLDSVDFIAYGFVDTTDVSRIYDDQTVTYNLATDNYDDQNVSPVLDDLLTVRQADGVFHKLNDGYTWGGTPIPVRLERISIPIAGQDYKGSLVLDSDSTKFIRRVHPRIKSALPVDFYIGAQDYADAPIAWSGPYTFDPVTDRFFDVRVNTKFVCYRVESEADTYWQLSSITFDMEIIGEAPYDR